MAEDSLQRPTIRAGGTHMVRVDLRNDLDEDDTISSASVAEASTSDLTLGSARVTTEETTILGLIVPTARAIEFTVAGHLAATGTYRLTITFSTVGGVVNKVCKEDFVFDVVA